MNGISLHQLEILAAIVECGSFTEAANHLYIAQSTVSNHINALEQSLNVLLFRRDSKRRVTLTPDGKRVYQYAVDILAKCRALCSDVMIDTTQTLRLGASTVPAQSLMPQYISELRRRAPQCCCELRCGDSEQIRQMLLDGDIQYGLVGSVGDGQKLLYEPVATDRLVVIAPNTPRFAELQQAGTLGRGLLDEPLIFREPGSGTQKIVDNYLRFISVPQEDIRVTAIVSDSTVLKNLVVSGVGISIISSLAARPRCSRASCCSSSWTTSPWSGASISPGGKRPRSATWPGNSPPSSAQ
jgi:DNA-binding transcriptional LysR family regulator